MRDRIHRSCIEQLLRRRHALDHREIVRRSWNPSLDGPNSWTTFLKATRVPGLATRSPRTSLRFVATSWFCSSSKHFSFEDPEKSSKWSSKGDNMTPGTPCALLRTDRALCFICKMVDLRVCTSQIFGDGLYDKTRNGIIVYENMLAPESICFARTHCGAVCKIIIIYHALDQCVVNKPLEQSGGQLGIRQAFPMRRALD